MKILAIDPGTTSSAWILWEGRNLDGDHYPNHELLETLDKDFVNVEKIAIEMIACYGMAVGAETLETILWIGRFIQASKLPVQLVYRKDVKLDLCGSMRAKDANVRQALIDLYGPVGTRKNPGPLYGVSKHIWSALAVAHYASRHPLVPSPLTEHSPIRTPLVTPF